MKPAQIQVLFGIIGGMLIGMGFVFFGNLFNMIAQAIQAARVATGNG